MIGGGGHAAILADILIGQGRKIIAILSPDDISQREVFSGIPRLEKDEDILTFSIKDILLINGIGMMPKSKLKRTINEYFLSLGYQYGTVVADSAIISPYVTIGEGVQILPMAIINTNSTIGSHTIINSGALIEHDCIVGSYNHIAPRSVLCGNVSTGDDVFIGASSTIIQNIEIPTASIIGAGSTITGPLEQRSIVFPSKSIIKIF